ncbi:hypothetical protein [Streptomyces sp. YGL11-2]|uniref:hypothetical protein n=1 Tax=Streptomyces sp. YGL11-2 TaxID=3414028 RepID=UPI003CF9702F
MQTTPVGARFDLTDAQWAALEPRLPGGAGRPSDHPRRRLTHGRHAAPFGI